MSRSKAPFDTLTAAVSAALLLALLLAAGCTSASSNEAGPADSVQQLLELRAVNSTDTAAYRRHVESSAVAEALAADSAARKASDLPTPEWRQPKTSSETSSSAEVEVVWERTSEFKDWPEATRFVLSRKQGRWLVVDAFDTSATAR